ncbi:MAG: EAL domain-containing protein, partial [Gammaproteobacteria bacterium]|nr:EAL domain-containing protein [Gammaproteobacteria bacterium]
DTGLKPGMLELEVTESVIQTTGKNIAIFEGLKALGVNIAIDDFGTGYSSLGSLRQMPINCLKVDRMFVKDMLLKEQDSILLGTIIGMAHALGYRVVAEGVEQLEQVLTLSGMGCDMIQGNFFSQPVPADRIPPLIQNGFRLQENEGGLRQSQA